MLTLALACAFPNPTPTKSTLDTSAVEAPPTGDTGAEPTLPTGDTGGGPVTLPPGAFVIQTLPWSPDVTDLAITSSGASCVSGSEWYYGYGSPVDQYVPGRARLNRVSADGVPDDAFAVDGFFEAEDTYGGTAVTAGPGDGCYLAVGVDFDEYSYTIRAASIVLVDPAGAIDPSFVAPILDHDPGAPEVVADLAPAADGGVYALSAAGTAVTVDKYGPDGSPDPSWGVNGEATLPLPAASWGELAVLADGSVLVGFGATVAKLDPGDLDPSWGVAGVATSAGGYRTHGMGATPDGGLVLAGYDETPFVESFDAAGQPALPPTGVALPYAEVYGAAVDDAGGIWLAARVDAPAVVRLRPDGGLETAWQSGGIAIVPPEMPGTQAQMDAIEVRSDGAVVAVGAQLRDVEMVGLLLAP
jgi:hypothetical protein